MPYYDKLKVSGQTNRENLENWLKTEKVAYADLYQALMEEDEVLYHARDSHWNNKGAALAADVLMDALGKDHDSYEGESYTVRRDYTGDLDTMLYPLASTADDEIYYDKETTYATVEEIQSNFDPRITTVNPVKEGSLVMYRDSFGNALLPYMADAYANAGVVGIIITCIIFALIFVYVDIISTQESNSYFLALLVPIAISFNDGALMTIFFSGGLSTILLVLTLIDFDPPGIREKNCETN